MRHEAIGVGEAPTGEGVGAETLMDKAEGRNAIGIAQIVVETADLVGEQQALVDYRAAGKARDIGLAQSFDAMLGLERLQRVQRLLADDDELALDAPPPAAFAVACPELLLFNPIPFAMASSFAAARFAICC